MTVGEVADVLLRDYAVANALNLDGGGSTTMALQDPMTGAGKVFNQPNDTAPGRSTGSNLGVFARPWKLPTMVLARGTGRSLVASWPTGFDGWHLEQNTACSLTGWVAVAASPQLAGNRMQVVLTPESGPRFYRLGR